MSDQRAARRVLITGASGFIGYHAIAPLLASGFEVVASYNRRAPPKLEGVTWVQANLLDNTGIRSLVQAAEASHLLHCAWYVEPRKMIGDVLNMHWVRHSLQLLHDFR